QFFRNMLLVLRNYMQDSWQVQITEVNELEKSKTEGYDFYIYEHTLPATMPTDGVVVCFDPTSIGASGLDIEFKSSPVDVPVDSTLGMGRPHPITQKIDPDSITISRYLEVANSEGYEELLFFQGSPVLLVKEEKDFSYVVFTFDVHRSSLPVNFGFPQMFLTIFNTYIPTTVSGNLFRVGDSVELNARASILNFSGPGVNETYEAFPKQFALTKPGSYTLTQTIRDEILTESFYVGVPAFESKINKEVDALPLLERTKRVEEEDWDLLIYFAAALIALLFAEWWLQSRENMR
ncbi:MAG: hypothetical protein K2N74_01780, partial [Clostridiales bacterium]|nr:hypothetical protein [Clostridiales bacterium]